MANCFLSWLVVPRSRISTGLLNVQTIWLLSPCSFSCLTPMINIRLQMETFYKLKTTTTTKLSLSSSRTTKEKSISGTSWNVDCILKGWVRSMKWLRRSSSSFLTTSSSSSNLSLKPFIRVSDTSPNCWKKSSNEPRGLNFKIANLLFKILSDQNHNFFVCDMWNFGAKIQIVTSVSPEKNIIISEKEDSHDKIKGA